MKIINKIIAGFLVSVSCLTNAEISELQPVAPDENNNPAELMGNNGEVKQTADGRYIIFVENNKTVSPEKVIFHRFDTQTKQTISSRWFESETYHDASDPHIVNQDGSIINFNYYGSDSELEGGNQYAYNFLTAEFIKLPHSSRIKDLSEDGKYQLGNEFIYGEGTKHWVLNRDTGITTYIPEYDLNGDGSKMVKATFVGNKVTTSGEIMVMLNRDNGYLKFKYNVVNGSWYSLTDQFSKESDLIMPTTITGAIQISENGRYVVTTANSVPVGEGNPAARKWYLMIDTKTDTLYRYEHPNEVSASMMLSDSVSNDGKAVIMTMGEYVDGTLEGTATTLIYDFLNAEVIHFNKLKSGDDISFFLGVNSLGTTFISGNNYTKGEVEFVQLNWAKVSSIKEIFVTVSVVPSSTAIDPYANQTSQFTIDVSGTDIYGLDVSCNVSSASLSVTQANYDTLFGSQNSVTLPLIYDATSVTGTEILVAPELAFTGAGSFVLADVIAEFTTEDVQITCAAEVSDENGQLLQVTVTPATIRVDDGVHGGTASVSGIIEIPGITDLSGVEVILTIDGRQVIVISDENGDFEFEGLRDGDFTISLASDNYVQSCQDANIVDGASVDLGSIELLAGDINADGSIDIADFTFMAARYRSNQGDADYDAKADLNKDGTINIQDLAILGSHFGSTQCSL